MYYYFSHYYHYHLYDYYDINITINIIIITIINIINTIITIIKIIKIIIINIINTIFNIKIILIIITNIITILSLLSLSPLLSTVSSLLLSTPTPSPFPHRLQELRTPDPTRPDPGFGIDSMNKHRPDILYSHSFTQVRPKFTVLRELSALWPNLACVMSLADLLAYRPPPPPLASISGFDKGMG